MFTTVVFSRNLKAFLQYKGTNTIIGNPGGQGSSKTRSILQLLFLIAKHSRRRIRITVASYALPHLKAGCINDFDEILTGEGIHPDNVRNKSDYTYYIGRGEITFMGIEGNEAKATGPRRDILFINEANRRIAYEIFELMNARTKIITFLDFNPSAPFWWHKKVIKDFKHVNIKSTYKDNPYLPARELENILSKKGKPGYENWWRVYGEGELGQLEGAILQNWKFGKFDTLLPYNYGLDFGVKHKDALVKVAIDRAAKLIYWKQELYKAGMSTDALANELRVLGVSNKLIMADSASPRTVLDLKKRGFNVASVSKNRIIDDIKDLMGFTIIVDPGSTDLEEELNNWIWLDKKGEVPIDEFDDLIDAGRYGTMFRIKPNAKKGQRSL